MDPVTASLMVAANMAVSYVGTSITQHGQKGFKAKQIAFEAEQIKLQAAQQSLEATKAYRENVALNAALSAMGVGSDTGLLGTLSESSASFRDSERAAQRAIRFADVQGLVSNANIATDMFSQRIGQSISSGVQTAQQLGLFKGKK